MAEWLMRLCLACLASGCTAPRPFPWPYHGERVLVTHAEVHTLNHGYDRRSSQVLVREVAVPTRANLDFAAYHHNVMLNVPAPVDLPPDPDASPHAAELFAGLVDGERVLASRNDLPLTEVERSRPLAFTPLVEWLAGVDSELTAGLEELRAAVRSEAWGASARPHIVRQQITEVFVHQGRELWLRIELQPWVRDFSDLPDEDRDGYAAFYVTPRAGLVPSKVFELIREQYAAHTLNAHEIHTWANELVSFWYPAHMTDLVELGATWPDENTEAEIRSALGGQSWENPTVVIVGKPHGAPIYNVLVIPGIPGHRSRVGDHSSAGEGSVTPDTAAVQRRIEAEVARHGSWKAWHRSLGGLHRSVRQQLEQRDTALKAFVGRDGFLFFRNSLMQMIADDFRQQAEGRNPFPAILQFKEILATRGVDFLFVPVPTKAAVFPDKLKSGSRDAAGKIVTPYERKLLLELSQAGVEVVDLLPLYRAERDKKGEQELYLAQDTHWSDRGLRLAARRIAARIKKYPWFGELEKTQLDERRVTFTDRGDLPSRLAASERKRYKPIELVGHQVLRGDGGLYEDVPGSRITILGDSFTGVYQRTFCGHAGVSAHIARELGTPVDLIMSYGGGPEVRRRLLRSGVEDLAEKWLVVWIMAARDLYGYGEGWDLLEVE